ncbi:unnamed protein product [Lupinus luteus]|uniref:Endoglucanase n=1 Tax=Lupinus luteus TaxID=3873 RepID=A0AAV1XAN8_LUPLU
MHSRNQWGGSFELSTDNLEVASGGHHGNSHAGEWDRAALLDHGGGQSQQQRFDLDETLQSWVLERAAEKKKKKYVDFGCIMVSHKALKWIIGSIVVAFCVIALPIIITKSLPKHHSQPTSPDNYTIALHKALLFFNAQKCLNGSTTPDDHYCWQKPEDMTYERSTITIFKGPDLAGEMAAALASASIVFQDDLTYSTTLIKGATTLFAFARDSGKRATYSHGDPNIQPYYNSTGYYDEYMWGAAWLYYATGNSSYISLATNPSIPKKAKAFNMIPDFSVLSWNNKLPAAMLLLTRFRMFLNPGYPYEDMLKMYHNIDYIMGKNPINMSYIVGYGNRFPKHVHHRGASTPNDNNHYSCTGGWKWRDNPNGNPNNITGAMVGGPDRFDQFHDSRSNYNFTEPTMAGNAGLVAALISLTNTIGTGIDKNTIFSKVPPLGPQNPPPPPPWKP